jgi:BirA family transcriptional regulator, biotin operon repressor / biotin---[acetyl-CoA-carboxylase] ligase
LSDRDPRSVAAASQAAEWRVVRRDSVASTNDEARARALEGDSGRLWIIARAQTQGRGRRGRVWTSPPGNLYASALLIDPAPAALAAQIGFVAGVALRSAVGDLGAGAEIQLKWPNDLVWRGAKLAGLLVEGLALGDGRFACIVGVGVNCASAPAGLAYPTDHLASALGRPIAPELLFARLAARFEEALAIWRGGAGFAAIRSQWLAHAAGLGGPIRIAGARGVREGVFRTLDAQGRLVLDGANGAEAIEAGDLFLIDGADG